jgi:tRNA (cmo5U34)-methyltransferase
MHSHPPHDAKLDAFGEDRARGYDDQNRYLRPITASLHYLIEILLSGAGPRSKILCVGAGTGAEIIALATAFPESTFVAVDPSAAMLEVCRDRLQDLGLADRCHLIPGLVHEAPATEDFDAAICLLVLHHASETERRDIISGVASRLRPGGHFITSELSHDLSSPTADDALEMWESLSRRGGIPEAAFEHPPAMHEEKLPILAPSEVEGLLQDHGFTAPIQFFQAFLIRAWYTRKKDA